MATYGSGDLKLEFDVTSGGALQDITAVVFGFSGIDIQAAIEDGTAFGVTFQAQLYSKFMSMADITLDMWYDDTAGTGTNAVFNHVGETRSFKVTYGGAKTTAVETIIKSFKRTPAKGKITTCQAVLTPTGTITEA